MLSSRRLILAIVAIFFLVVIFQTQSYRNQNVATPPSVSLPNNPPAPAPAPPVQSEAVADPAEPPSATTTSPSPKKSLTKEVIIASTKEEDTSWVKKEIPDIKATVYVVDDDKAEHTVPANKGHEGMVYLTYMIERYDSLPDVMIFLHAHQLAWHNNDLLNSDAAQMIQALSAEHVQRQGYFNMRCHWDPGCPDWMHPFDPSNRTDISKPEERVLAEALKEIFPDRPVPEIMATPCCAQFALSKEAVQRVPLAELERYRNWLLNTKLHDILSGRVWEYLWHYVFSDFTPVVCQAMDVCYCDGFGVCFGGDKGYADFTEHRNDLGLMQISLREWEKEYKESKEQWSKGAEGVKAQLQRKIKEAEKIVKDKVDEAKIRGKDPKSRAQDVGRKWQPGDGY